MFETSNWIYNESIESLAEIIIINETEQFLLKYKHGNNIHEHGKQQNK